MNNQEAFDKVVAHLKTQKKRSTESLSLKAGDKCLYRGPNGLKCAIGCLIPDELYDNNMDYGGNSSIQHALEKNPALAKYFSGIPLLLLSDLQRAHDAIMNWDENGFNETGFERLKIIASDFNLTYPE